MALPSFTKAEAPAPLLGPCLMTVALCLSCAKLFLRGLGDAFFEWRNKTSSQLASLLPLAILGAGIVTGVPARAQTQIPDVTTDPTFETGIRQYGSYHGGKIDSINLSNGSLTADVPLIFYPQRGGKLKLNFVLHYFNEGWFADQQCGLTQCFLTGRGSWFHGWALIESDEPATPSNAGPGLGGISGSTVGGPSCTAVQGTSPQQYLCVASIVMPDGTVHSAYPIGLTTFMAVDRSGYRLDTFPGKLPGT